jgi:ferredoxin
MIERVQILFATGTGNSYKVACWAEDFLKIKGIPVRVDPLHAFAKDLSPAFAPGTLLGISVPTHGFTAQWSVLKKVAALPRGNGSLAYVTACCAGMKVGPLHVPGLEASAGWLIAWMLFLKNFKVRAVNGVDMPSNWLVVHPGFSEKSAAFMAARCRNKLILLLQRVVEGKTHFPYRAWINLVMGIVLFPVSLGYNLVGRLVLAKMLFADARCTSCGQCARMCPVQAITMRGTRKPFPRWSFKCESCMRCVGFCPTQAIEMNSLWFAAAFWFLFWGWKNRRAAFSSNWPYPAAAACIWSPRSRCS